ncbi:MAG: tripartite tricarboxylate transporter TctB family protein [Bacillota bacterium]
MSLAVKLASAALVAMAAILIVLSRTLDYMKEGVPGPGFAPLWYGLVLLASSGLLAFQARRGGAGAGDRPLVESPAARARVLKYVVGTVVAVALVPLIGLLPALVAFLTYFVRTEGGTPWTKAILLGVGVPLLFWVTFGLFLGVDFPWGVLGS